MSNMRLFSATPKSSPELVRHSQVSRDNGAGANTGARGDTHCVGRSGRASPPRDHSPASLVRGVSTLGRKVSRRFGESEAARKLRMASPSRKYQWAVKKNDAVEAQTQQTQLQQQPKTPRKRVSRVDSFRHFLSLVTASTASAIGTASASSSSMRTPRAVKRRSRNNKHVDASTSTSNVMSSTSLTELSLTQSEADLCRFFTDEDEEDELSVVSEGRRRRRRADGGGAPPGVMSLSAGPRLLGRLPENRAIGSFGGSVFKSYGMIDGIDQPRSLENNKASCKSSSSSSIFTQERKTLGHSQSQDTNSNNSERKTSAFSQESGYSSDYASGGASPNSSSRASPRNSLDEGDSSVSSTLDNDNNNNNNNNSILNKKSDVTRPVKPIRSSKVSKTDVLRPSRSPSLVGRDYKMVRLSKDRPTDELGIIIAKKKLKELQTTGFQVVHVEPNGLVDR